MHGIIIVNCRKSYNGKLMNLNSKKYYVVTNNYFCSSWCSSSERSQSLTQKKFIALRMGNIEAYIDAVHIYLYYFSPILTGMDRFKKILVRNNYYISISSFLTSFKRSWSYRAIKNYSTSRRLRRTYIRSGNYYKAFYSPSKNVIKYFSN